MLVLSRRVEQEILFPHLGITVSVLQVRGKVVKIGIVAPEEIRVVRPESIACQRQFLDSEHAADLSNAIAPEERDRLIHRRRNQLNILQLRIDAIQSRIERGETVDAEAMLQNFFKETDSFAAEVGRSSVDPTARQPIRLLVVEDCDNERSLMSYVLSTFGFIVTVARDGNEAFQQLIHQRGTFDLILMDIEMPIADGHGTLERIRRHSEFGQLKVFAVTGSPRQPKVEPATHGWDGWYSKPVDMPRLAAKIREEITESRSPMTLLS